MHSVLLCRFNLYIPGIQDSSVLLLFVHSCNPGFDELIVMLEVPMHCQGVTNQSS